MLHNNFILYNIVFFFNIILDLIIYKKENILNSVYLLLNYLNSNTLLFTFLSIMIFNKIQINSLILTIITLFYSIPNKQEYVSFPQTLLFGYNIYHPPMFYLTYFLIINICLNTRSKTRISNNLVFVLITMSLILGMFWGSVHSSWGFFWSSDYIEYVLFATSLIIVCKIHIIFFKFNQKLFYYTIAVLVLFIFLLRLNFFTTIHSFFQNFYLKNILNIFNLILTLLNYNFMVILYIVVPLILTVNMFLSLIITTNIKVIKIRGLIIFLHLVIFIILFKFLSNFFLYFINLNTLNLNFSLINFILKTQYVNLASVFIENRHSTKLFTYNLFLTNNFNSHRYFLYLSIFYYQYLWLISFLKIFKK